MTTKIRDAAFYGISSGPASKTELNPQAKEILDTVRMAEHFNVRKKTGEPATQTIIDWWHSGKIPPPDLKISQKAIYWKRETIDAFVENGGVF